MRYAPVALAPIAAPLALSLLAGACDKPNRPEPQRSDEALGRVDFPVSCNAPARTEFTRALALLHHMTYPRAREGFERAAAADPRCAMAYWGVAMTQFQPLWPTRPGPDALERGWQAAEKARTLEPPTALERSFVAAVEAFFQEPASPDYWLRVRRWEHAAEQTYDSFPGNEEAAAFYALALLADAPSSSASQARAQQASEILLRIYRENPDHPGAMHYLIHADDAPGRERQVLDVAHRYDMVAPRNPHALHMPTHIYTRLGDWDAVIKGNVAAAQAALETPAGDRGEFVWDEFPHAVEYLVYAYLQKGEDDSAAAQMRRLHATPRLQPTFKTAFHLASTQARYALERQAWTEAAAIVPRTPAALEWDQFPWAEAIAWFARGLGAAHLGRMGDAADAAGHLARLEAAAGASGEDLFARNIGMLRLELSGWIAHAGKRDATALERLREAAELEAATPKHAVTPAPTLPALELLGDLQMERKHPAEALAAYRSALELYPRRLNALAGAARAARAAGDDSLAHALYRQLLDLARGGTRPALGEARVLLGERP